MAGTRPTGSTSPEAVVIGWSSAVFVVLGLVGPSWGPALVPVRAHFHLSLAAAGSLFLVSGAAGVCGSLAAGYLSERGNRRLLIAGYGMAFVVSVALVALAPRWWTVLAGVAGTGMAGSALTTEASALVALASGGRRGSRLSVINAAYGIGAAVGPITVGALLALGAGWRLPFAIWGLLAGAVVGAFVVSLGRRPNRGHDDVANAAPAAGGPRPSRRQGTLPLGPELLTLWGVSFTYNGVGWAIVGWSATWLVDRFGTGLLVGASSATTFYVFLTLGRFVNMSLADRVRLGRLLLAECLLTAAGLVGASVTPNALAAIGAFALVGLAMGGLNPNVTAQSIGLAPNRPGALSASASIAGSVGTMTVPFLTGALGGSRAAMSSMLVWAAVISVLGVLTSTLERRRHSASEVPTQQTTS